MGFDLVWMILWLGVLVVLVVVLVRWLGGGIGMRARGAREILDERYAAGEIDREEYEKRKRDIGGG